MAKKDKVVKKVENKLVEKEVIKEEVVTIINTDESIDDVFDDAIIMDNTLIESNLGTFEEEIMTEKVDELVDEKVIDEKIEPLVEEKVIEETKSNNSPNKFKRMFGYIWNGQICE